MLPLNLTSDTCPVCGTGLSSELTVGLCPKCLLASAIDEPSDRRLCEVESAQTLDSGSLANVKQDALLSQLEGSTRRFGDYELLHEIARGGMGVVYKARHLRLGREVALKVILSGQFASPNDVRRFEMEAESAAALDHSGIVPIYEIGEHQGHHYFTMKLIEGGSLAQEMSELRGDMRRFIEMLAQVAEAIDYAHRRGILHRDIKPANILLDSSGHPLVTDLGLAKRTEAVSDITGTGAIVGTPAYMPPEQASASKEVTTSADIYAIGAILYEGLTGRPPHKGDSPLATLMLAAKGDIQPPSEFNGQCDRVLELICMKCLSREPNDRYASSSVLAKDLRCWLNGESVSVRPKSFVSVFSELITYQLRSALGAVLIGIIGGLATGLPVYSGLALSLFGRSDSQFNLTKLRSELPNLQVVDAWWLHPPEWISRVGFLASALVAIFLGVIIQWIVRPKETRQAIAIGLVTGLLMTIVQFSMYGIAADWQTFNLVNSKQVDLLAQASMAPEPQRKLALEKLNDMFPDLETVDPSAKGELLGKAISVTIMLASPTSFLGVLCVCLAFSTIYCVGGTVHCNRLVCRGFGNFSVFVRYLEVMLLMTLAMVTLVVIVFFTFGMMANANGTRTMPPSLFIVLGVLLAATIPGWKMMRWYYRWPVYVISLLIVYGLAVK